MENFEKVTIEELCDIYASCKKRLIRLLELEAPIAILKQNLSLLWTIEFELISKGFYLKESVNYNVYKDFVEIIIKDL